MMQLKSLVEQEQSKPKSSKQEEITTREDINKVEKNKTKQNNDSKIWVF